MDYELKQPVKKAFKVDFTVNEKNAKRFFKANGLPDFKVEDDKIILSKNEYAKRGDYILKDDNGYSALSANLFEQLYVPSYETIVRGLIDKIEEIERASLSLKAELALLKNGVRKIIKHSKLKGG